MTNANDMLIEWLGDDRSAAAIERLALYLSRTLHIGGIRACRALVLEALTSDAQAGGL